MDKYETLREFLFKTMCRNRELMSGSRLTESQKEVPRARIALCDEVIDEILRIEEKENGPGDSSRLLKFVRNTFVVNR